jgi:hypothetical protein
MSLREKLEGECLVFRGTDIEVTKPILSIEKFRIPISEEEIQVR